MDATKIEAGLRRKIAEYVYDGERDDFAADEDLFNLGLDSLDVNRLMVYIEDEYGAVIPDDDVVPENISTLKALVALVQKHR